jgi:hypothetical protein
VFVQHLRNWHAIRSGDDAAVKFWRAPVSFAIVGIVDMGNPVATKVQMIDMRS